MFNVIMCYMDQIIIVKDKISRKELIEMAKTFYITMIKGVVDIDNEIVAFGGEYHIDASNVLVQMGYKQSNIWGFNFVFDKPNDSAIEYISLINIKPSSGNLEMEVVDEDIRNKMKRIILSKIK